MKPIKRASLSLWWETAVWKGNCCEKEQFTGFGKQHLSSTPSIFTSFPCTYCLCWALSGGTETNPGCISSSPFQRRCGSLSIDLQCIFDLHLMCNKQEKNKLCFYVFFIFCAVQTRGLILHGTPLPFIYLQIYSLICNLDAYTEFTSKLYGYCREL